MVPGGRIAIPGIRSGSDLRYDVRLSFQAFGEVAHRSLSQKAGDPRLRGRGDRENDLLARHIR